MINAIDLFAGPGGWDCAAKALGLDPLGVEWDDAACATREAAGLLTVQASVAELDPTDHAPCDLLIASPPCPTFSSAGKGDGIADLGLVYQLADAIALDPTIDVHAALPDEPWRDTRSRLVIEPLRWALQLEPRFLAWEQVPPVLPFWEYCAEILRRKGYSVFTGIFEAERFGIPQTRERAVLMADREGPVHPPRPTHQRYVKGEPQRHEVTLEGEVLPWVSMAEALGWIEGDHPSPAPTVSGGGTGSGGGVEVFAGTDARERVRQAVLVNGNQENATERDADEPASTVAFGHNAARVEWVYDRRQSESAGVRPRPAEEPAPTICGAKLAKGVDVWREWGGDGPQPDECPATTVAGGPRLSSRTHHNEGEQNAHAIRVSLEGAVILQSFPPDYPFQGTKSQRYLQVGNAIPPLLAKAILSALLAPVLEHVEAPA